MAYDRLVIARCQVLTFDNIITQEPMKTMRLQPLQEARSLPNQGHSPTKAEVKRMNQCLLDENLCLKKDFHKANHRLKSLLADKKDLLRRLRMESKTSNRLIESIQLEANDMMKRSRYIFADANRCKIETELLNDEIETSQDVLLRERQDLRKQSAWLKKQAEKMTETHKRRKTALYDQQKAMEHDVITKKQRWNASIRLAQKKMMSSLKQLQNEHVMWQVLSQEAQLRCEDAKLEVHRQKSNGRTYFRCKWKRPSGRSVTSNHICWSFKKFMLCSCSENVKQSVPPSYCRSTGEWDL